MAAIVSVQSGTWSNPATWSTGIVPGPDDTVTIGNNDVVTIDSNVSVTTITNAGSGRIVLTGSTAYTITASADLTWNVTASCSPGMFTFDSNYSAEGTVIQAQRVIIGQHRHATPLGYFVLDSGSSGSVTIDTGSIDLDTNTSGGTKYNLQNNGTADVVINCSTQSQTQSNGNNPLYLVSGGGSLTYNGDFNTISGSSGSGCVVRVTSGVAAFTGDIYAVGGPIVNSIASSRGTVYLQGDIFFTSSTGTISNGLGGVSVVVGRAYESTTIGYGVNAHTTSPVLLNTLPFYRYIFTYFDYNQSGMVTSQVVVAKNANLSVQIFNNPTYYPEYAVADADLSPGDVREGVLYDSDDKVGALNLPDPADVALGVPVGDTVGTAMLKASDVAMITGSQITALAAQDPPDES